MTTDGLVEVTEETDNHRDHKGSRRKTWKQNSVFHSRFLPAAKKEPENFLSGS
jgi:hypothetical protein